MELETTTVAEYIPPVETIAKRLDAFVKISRTNSEREDVVRHLAERIHAMAKNMGVKKAAALLEDMASTPFEFVYKKE